MQVGPQLHLLLLYDPWTFFVVLGNYILPNNINEHTRFLSRRGGLIVNEASISMHHGFEDTIEDRLAEGQMMPTIITL